MAVSSLLHVAIRPRACRKRSSAKASGLMLLPKTGHVLNFEEPDLINWALAKFFARVETGRWTTRDPCADPNQIIRTT